MFAEVIRFYCGHSDYQSWTMYNPTTLLPRQLTTSPPHHHITSPSLYRVMEYMASDIPKTLSTFKSLQEKNQKDEAVGVVALLTQVGRR